jgi:hypothetical protein
LTACTDNLPAVYGRHNSSNVLKGFSIRITAHNEFFAATAVANLGPPKSLAEDFDLVLEDDFLEVMSDEGALDALEQLYEEVMWLADEGKNSMCDIYQTMNLLLTNARSLQHQRWGIRILLLVNWLGQWALNKDYGTRDGERIDDDTTVLQRGIAGKKPRVSFNNTMPIYPNFPTA